MKTNLISITKPCVKNDSGEFLELSAEQFIVWAARVSNPTNQTNMETAPKLIKYLIDNAHWSPFEMAHMTIEIETNCGISPQILRHKSASFQQFSLRYAKANDFEYLNARRQDSKNRQNSIDDLDPSVQQWWQDTQKEIFDLAARKYSECLEKGIAKECARNILPFGTKTRLFISAPVRTYIHYLQVRLDKSTQKEHRDIAEGIKSIFIENFPDTSKALGWLN